MLNISLRSLASRVSEFKRQHGDIWLDLDDMAAIEGRQFIDTYPDTQPNKLVFRQTNIVE